MINNRLRNFHKNKYQSLIQCQAIYKQQKSQTMQQTFTFPYGFQTQPVNAIDQQYIMIPGAHYPYYFVSFSTILNYEIPSQNIPLDNFTYIQNPFQQLPAVTATPECSLNQIPFNTYIQNGKSQTELFPQLLKKKPGVKKQNGPISGQKARQQSQKRGNERFIKKNTQSNVVNQIFSFLWTPQKSKPFLLKILESEEKIEIFYQLMRTIKTHCKSQLNRFYLKSLIYNSEWQSGLKRLRKKVKKIGCIPPEQLCLIVRKLVYLYLRELSFLSIMTSKKMNHQLWKLHLQKCKEVIKFLFEQAPQQ